MNDDVRQALADLLGSIPTDSGEPDARKTFHRLLADGWTQVGLPQELGGSGGDIAETAAIVTACAASPHLLPLADIVIVTNTVLQMAQMRLPPDVGCAFPLASAATQDLHGGVAVRADRVPWGRWASHFLVFTGDTEGATAHLLDATAAEISPGSNLAQEPRDGVSIAGVQPTASRRVDRSVHDVICQVQLAGALARSIQIASAAEFVLSMTVSYCSDRHQFGRRLADFQAVQQELAAIKGEVAAARAAVDLATNALAGGDPLLPVGPIAVAKVRAGLAAGHVARSAHQLHGAIGITQEYPLHRYTCALWSWRDEYGSESIWAASLLDELMADVSVSPWERLTTV